jgi:serpin B
MTSFIELDEEGTEAAAATAVIMDNRATSDPPRIIEMRIDRPFLIRDRQTGAVLFIGRVVNPA